LDVAWGIDVNLTGGVGCLVFDAMLCNYYYDLSICLSVCIKKHTRRHYTISSTQQVHSQQQWQIPHGLDTGTDHHKVCVCCSAGVIATIAWVFVSMTPLFFYFSQTNMLRALDCDQSLGLDTTHHGGPAYSAWDVDKVAAGGMSNPGGPAATTPPVATASSGVRGSIERPPRVPRDQSDALL
jgi:hypothetical protein